MVERNSLIPGYFSLHREKTGAPVTADSAPDASWPNRREMVSCDGYTTINALVKLTGGTTPTVDLQTLVYDSENDEFGVADEATGVSDADVARMGVHRNRAFLRISGVTGSPTGVEVWVGPAEAAPWPQR